MQRVAAQSIIYGNFVDDWQRAFQEISHAGFSGIELFQSPSNLVTLESELGFASAQKPKPTIESILQTLQNLNLTMLGLTGGPIEERIEFSGHFNHQEKLPYIYIEDWNTEIENLYNIHTETVFALHPHISRPVETYEEAIKLLGEKRRVKFLPDTAHIGIRSKQILPLLREYNHRIAAVHLKDWDHRYGKSRITYARGFTELGKGSLNLEELRDWLTSVYTGWIVIEQDFTTSRPIDSLKRSLSWLNKEKSGTVYSLPIFSRQTQKSPGSIPDLLDGCSRGLNDFYSSLSDFTAAHFACKTIDIWEINNRERVADYVASYPTRSEVFQPVGKNLIEVDFYDCLSHRRPKISRQEPGGARVLYLPIANYFNPNDVLLVLIATLSENFEYIEWSSFLYYHKLISHIYVKFWIARISEIRETFLFFYDNSLDISDYLEKSAIHIRTLLGCDEVSIYLESSDHAHLQCRGKSRSGGKSGGNPHHSV